MFSPRGRVPFDRLRDRWWGTRDREGFSGAGMGPSWYGIPPSVTEPVEVPTWYAALRQAQGPGWVSETADGVLVWCGVLPSVTELVEVPTWYAALRQAQGPGLQARGLRGTVVGARGPGHGRTKARSADAGRAFVTVSEGYCPCSWYFASVAAFCGFHHDSLSRYQAIVSARPASKSLNAGVQPSSVRSFDESIA